MQVITIQTMGRSVRGLLTGVVLALLAACGGETPDRSVQQQVQNDSATATTTDETDAGQISTGTLVLMKTSLGDIELSLDAERAPLSVENFLAYADSGHYDGTVFHRVISGFMVQGGGFDANLQQKATQNPIENEAANGLKNVKYSIAMARTSVVNSATSQFFINVVDNAFLDHRDTSAAGYGYAVFGNVVSGMDVVDKIAAVQTGASGRFPSDVPVETVMIESVTRK